MTLQELTDALKPRFANSGLGKSVLFDLGSAGQIHIDATGATPVVTNEAKDADAVLSLSQHDLEGLIAGQVDPTFAYMTGKLKVKGDMSVAMKLGQLLEG